MVSVFFSHQDAVCLTISVRFLHTDSYDFRQGMDMYSRVKRIHRPAQRFGVPVEEPPRRVHRFVAESSSDSEEEEEEEEEPAEGAADAAGPPPSGEEPRGEDAPPEQRLRPAPRAARSAARSETKVIKKYYLRENRREPEFYQGEWPLTAAERPAGWRGGCGNLVQYLRRQLTVRCT